MTDRIDDQFIGGAVLDPVMLDMPRPRSTLHPRPFSFWYVGTPYTRFPDGIEMAFVKAAFHTGELVKQGVPVFSPIAHTHPVAIHGEIDPLDLTLWLALDEPMMKAAGGMIVVQMTGWAESKGVRHEIEMFTRMGKPILFWDPMDDIPIDDISSAMAGEIVASHAREALEVLSH